MAIARENNITSQQRIDVVQLRSIESGVCGDFDVMAGAALAGKVPLVISGLHVVTTGITLATSLILQVADSVLVHFLATASGSIFHIIASEPDQVLSNANPKLVGGWTANSVNYVGLDLIRAPDSTTSDLCEIMDTVSLVETPVTQPLAVTTDYRIVISTSDFDASPGVCPIAKVTLDAGGAIVSIQDSRNFMFRLGSGGTVPNVLNTYSWPGGRNEAGSLDPFAGADKAITSFKAFNDAITTRLWELGGGEHWYSPTADRNIRLATTGSPFVSNGMFMEFVGGNLHWKGLVLVFDNSMATFNAINDQTTNVAGLTDLVSGECIYVDIDRSVNHTGGTSLNAVKGALATLGTPTIPGSRWVLAWNYNGSIFIRDQSFAVGSTFILATTSAAGTVKLSASDSVGAGPFVATVDSVSFLARSAGVTRGYINGINTTTSFVSDFIGGTGDIIIGGGFDGADGHGGGNPVDFNIRIETSRAQDEIRINGAANYTTNSAACLSVGGFNANMSNILLARFASQDSRDPSSRNSVFHVYGDGSLGFVNQLDANPGNPLPPNPNPVAFAEVRSKLFTKDNGLASPNKRDQLCWITWDGTVYVMLESNPY
jgi:hypothetical protein